MIGVIRGAMSMAPMTTATEFAASPITAIVTDSPSMNMNRVVVRRVWGGMSRARISSRSERSKRPSETKRWPKSRRPIGVPSALVRLTLLEPPWLLRPTGQSTVGLA